MSANTIKIKRFKASSNSIIGNLFINDLGICNTLELPYKDNQKNISSIPIGRYKWIKRNDSPKYKYEHIHVVDVENRSFILIHIGNYPKETNGCIMVGEDYVEDMVINSHDAFQLLMYNLEGIDEGELIIVDDY